MNLKAFNLGRNYFLKNNSEIDLSFKNQITNEELDFEELYNSRKSRLMDYGGNRYVDKFVNIVNKSLTIDNKLAKAVIEGYFKVLYRKDEYEVARLHVNYLNENLNLNFFNIKKLNFFLAPPFLNFIKINGRPKKFKFGKWIIIFFHFLIFLKPLRDSIFDIFSFSKERKLEKKLIKSYENDLDFIFKNFNNDKNEILIDFAKLPIKVVGFGPVKMKSIENYYKLRSVFYDKIENPNIMNLNVAE